MATSTSRTPGVAASEEQWIGTSAATGPFSPLLDGALTAERALQPKIERTIAACMSKAGFRYNVEPQLEVQPVWNPYGLMTATVVSRQAYTGPPTDPPPDSNGSMLAAMPSTEAAAWKDALLGTNEKHVVVSLPSGRTYAYAPQACTVKAQSAVLGPNFVESQLYVQDQANKVIGLVLTSTAARAALQSYSACVAASGLGPVSALTDLAERAARLPQQDSTAQESRFVAVDASCQQHAGVAVALTRSQTSLATKVVAAEPGTFRDLAVALGKLGYPPGSANR